MRLSVQSVEVKERPVNFRLAFRFGVVTLTESPQVFVRLRVRDEAGNETTGVAAEMLAPKWFDKDTSLSNDDNFVQLRQALRHAADLYRAAGAQTPFGLYAACYETQLAQCAADGLGPLVASYGPALLDRAVLDGACKLSGVSFNQAMAANQPGIEVGPLTPDLEGFDIAGFLASRKPLRTLEARHTVGLVDPITVNPEPLNDGLPETLAEIADTYGHRYYKLKVGGDLDEDIGRLSDIAAVLDGRDYQASLDGNEQYKSVDGVVALLDRIEATPTLANLWSRVIFIEQPMTRAVALSQDIGPIASRKPVIIDESDATLDAFPQALALGYNGVSSKSCKGFYKSTLNAARCADGRLAPGRKLFLSAEDLTMQAGIAIQQDLALVAFLGITHIERNGHHFVNGMAALSETEQQSFLDAVPGLYERKAGAVRLKIADGKLDIASLDRPGFASGGEPDWSAMSETFTV
ncbi:MAG: hypothetical protein RIM84_20070 [Alphaproteobacteria bacterium]